MSLTRSELIKELDSVFSMMVKLMFVNHLGMIKCCSCYRYKHRTEIQLAHNHGRARMIVRRYLKNVGLACSECNMNNPGEHIKGLRERLIGEYGLETYKETEEIANDIASRTVEELQTMLSHFKNNITEIEKEKKMLSILGK